MTTATNSAFKALSLPGMVQMLTPAGAYALSRASKQVKVCFEEIGFRLKIKYPMAYCSAAYCKGTEEWDVDMALFIYEDANCTPYKTKKSIVSHFFAKTMTRNGLLEIGTIENDLRAQRLAWFKRQGYFRDDNLCYSSDDNDFHFKENLIR